MRVAGVTEHRALPDRIQAPGTPGEARGGLHIAQADGVVAVPGARAVATYSPAAAGRGPVVVPRIGLRFSRHLPYEAWLDLGRQLSAVAASSAWCLGDWLAYGQNAYEHRYRDAIEATGLDYQTLRNYAWVARRFELSRRRDSLSFGHHAEVASLARPEQDYWLRKASEHDWSTSQMRREVRASLRERADALESSQEPRPSNTSQDGPARSNRHSEAMQVIKIPLTPEQTELCEQAATRRGLPLSAWAAQALDNAARTR